MSNKFPSLLFPWCSHQKPDDLCSVSDSGSDSLRCEGSGGSLEVGVERGKGFSGEWGLSQVSLLLSRDAPPLRNPRDREGTQLVPTCAKLPGRLLACCEAAGGLCESSALCQIRELSSPRPRPHAPALGPGWAGGRHKAQFVTASSFPSLLLLAEYVHECGQAPRSSGAAGSDGGM